MNSIGQPIPTVPVGLNGYLDLVMLASLATVVVIFALLLWSVRAEVRERIRLFCPVRLRRVRVLFRIAPNGQREDVLRCSVFGRRPVTCGKVCLHAARA
ncbi:MAG TPA: hypothetical protein VKA21_05120 [Candidatus Binatia bacterium]|nr:hypothetical protein [Candidatus Binatia bacterium]